MLPRKKFQRPRMISLQFFSILFGLGFMVALIGGVGSSVAQMFNIHFAPRKGRLIRDVRILNVEQTWSSSEENPDRFYRIHTSHGLFEIRDGWFLGWRAGHLYSNLLVNKGNRCSFEIVDNYVLCGKYGCIIRICSCRN